MHRLHHVATYLSTMAARMLHQAKCEASHPVSPAHINPEAVFS